MPTPETEPHCSPTRPFRLHLSLRSALLGAAFCLGLLMVGPLAWFNYSRTSAAALEVAADAARMAGENMAVSTRLFVQPVAFLGGHIQLLPSSRLPAKGFQHPLLPLFLDLLADNPQLYSLYFGYANGDFFQVVSLNANPRLLADLQAPVQARFALRSIETRQGQRLESWRLLDATLQVLTERPPQPAAYDPRTRPWYSAALKADGPVLSSPYVFSSTQSMGMTFSHRTDSSPATVFGVDLTLDALSKFLAKGAVGPSGLTFIFAADGALICHPDPARLSRPGPGGTLLPASVESLNDPRATALFQLFSRSGNGEVAVQPLHVEGVDYLMHTRPLNSLSGGKYTLAVIVRADDFTAPLAKTRNTSLLFALGLFFVALPGLAFLAGHFAKSLSSLAEEADRIRGLDMSSCLRVHSPVDEVDRLGTAVTAMRGALSTFSRYLPRSLMKKFIDSGLDPVLGGERRELTVLFTDVENFTPLAEDLTPEDLMRAMSEYFQAVGQAILDSGGTIDKFIGDAVMAFWNAPTEALNHVEQACQAALLLSRASEELNLRRAGAGLPLLRTRVGLHTGAAVVGNVGAADRMDYTALGATVNLASRLEGLNKFYGTRIMASREVRDRARKQFLFRSVDVVVPKGAVAPMAVFELMGSLPSSPYPKVAAPRASLGFCSRWERAIALYRTVQWGKAQEEFQALQALQPDDRLAAMYATRARRLQENRPGKDWKAVERFKEK